MREGESAREARLKEALRENLRKRKARDREAGEPPGTQLPGIASDDADGGSAPA